MLFNHNVCAASDPSVKRHVLSKHELYQNNHHIQTNQRNCKGGIMETPRRERQGGPRMEAQESWCCLGAHRA
jgi:hypothetical protein